MTNQLDELGREAAEDLYGQVALIDSDAALARLDLGDESGVRRLVPGPGWGRRVLAVAAVLVVMGAAVVSIRAARHDDESVGVATDETAPINADAYGPVVDSIKGADSPTLRADLHARLPLDDGDQVALVVEGGLPGSIYSVDQCSNVFEPLNSPGRCRVAPVAIDLDDAGRGVATTRVWTVFESTVTPERRHDCRREACRLEVRPLIDDLDPPDYSPPGFSEGDTDGVQVEPDVLVLDVPGGDLGLPFGPAAAAPVTPQSSLELELATPYGDPIRVRVSGSDLAPGAYAVQAVGFDATEQRIPGGLDSIGQVDLATTVVGADGRLDVIVAAPLTIQESGAQYQNDVRVVRGPVLCLDDGFSCDIRITRDPGRDNSVRILVPPPMPYPAVP